MDPAIADLVSTTFYDGALKTARSRELSAKDASLPFTCREPMPASPVVVVDYPHVSSTGRRDPAERGNPRWHNPAEIDSVVHVLRHIRAVNTGGEKPTLAVLSPYAAQVRLLDERLQVEKLRNLAHLRDFAPVRVGSGLVGTVDSFQGSEADVVIISLVRNNPRVGLAALGFLRERRRMNVMMSRAKHKVVLVGSLSFLMEAVRGVNPDKGDHGLSFISRMVESIHDLAMQERQPGLRLASIIPPEQLRRTS